MQNFRPEGPLNPPPPPPPPPPSPPPTHPSGGARDEERLGGSPAYNPYDLLGQADDLRARVTGLQAALDHHERLATLGTLTGLIAHEFNNILTPVMSYAQMALARPDDRELTAKALHKAVEGSERAASIAAAILGFCRDESVEMRTGRNSVRGPRQGGASDGGCAERDVPRGTSDPLAESPAPPPPRCDVQSVIEETFACLARDPSKDGIKVDVDVEPGLEAAARAVTLQHVVLNLVLNARNAMLPQGGRLTLRGYRTSDRPRVPGGAITSLESDQRSAGSTWNLEPARSSGGVGRGGGGAAGWVVIEIADNGSGMTGEQLANLFRPFFTTGRRVRDHSRCCGLPNCEGDCGSSPDQGLSSDDAGISEAQVIPATRERRRGTGLGMTICKRLLAECGGWLFVESQPGRGTSATIVVAAAPMVEHREVA